MSKVYSLPVDFDPESQEYLLTLNEEILAETGWKMGDRLEWTDLGNGSWRLSKIPDEKIYLVETISVFRHRYAVRAEKEEHACDIVVCEEVGELSQKHLNETIVSSREITEEEYIKIFDQDNDYLKGWNRDKKLSMIRQIKT